MIMKKNTKKIPQPQYPDTQGPESFEMYGRPHLAGSFDHAAKPDSLNGKVRFERYRVTVEKIEEPLEVLHERLRQIYAEVKGSRRAEAVLEAAKELGVEL